LHAAKSQARILLGRIENGEDPFAEEQAKQVKLTSNLFKDVAERFLTVKDRHNKYWEETRRIIAQYAYPDLKDTPITEIRRGDIKAVIEETEQHSQSTARLLFAALRPLFDWACEHELIELSPMSALKPPAPSKKRKRVLSDAEIRAYWQATAIEPWPWQSILRLFLFTGQRREQVSGLRWRELDLDKGIWTLPPPEEFTEEKEISGGKVRYINRTKNKEKHVVHLSPEAIALLDPIEEACWKRLVKNGEHDFVFSTTGYSAPSGYSKLQDRVRDNVQVIIGKPVPHWTFHDVRRTVSTSIQKLGYNKAVAHLVIGHISSGKDPLDDVYMQHEYLDERREALMKWSRHVIEVVGAPDTPSNVIPLASRRTGAGLSAFAS
jgi:integrase